MKYAKHFPSESIFRESSLKDEKNAFSNFVEYF